MRVWRAAPDEAPAVASLLGGFRDHFGGDWPDDASLLASVERITARDDAEYFLAARLDVNSENTAALALYRSLGFRTGKTGGQDLLMRRRL